MVVEWTRMTGDAIEELVAVMLCRRFPAATLIRPSVGDGGIDVLVPLPAGGVEVYQVKKFSSNLTSGQKSQIAGSFDRLEKFRKETSLDVQAWHLTLPLNPTKENLVWLQETTEAATFPCAWRGLVFVDGLASEFPDVIDYYLHDGADRLAIVVDQMMRAMMLQPKADGSGIVTPTQLAEYLQSVQPLLDTDPHFKYSISLDHQMSEPSNDPGLIVAVTSSTANQPGPAVTVKVFPRLAAALEFRPIPLNVTFRAEPGSQFAKDLEAFQRYGTPLEAPAGSVDVDADLPGGLGGSFEGASARIGAPLGGAEPGAAYSIRLACVDPAGAVQAEVVLDMQPVSVGMDRTGIRAHGTDRDKVLDFEVLTDLTDQRMKFNLSTRDLSGRFPNELLNSLKFLTALHTPNELAIAAPFGPISGPTISLDDAGDWLDGDALRRLQHLIELLVAIQAHTTVQLAVPPLKAIDADAIKAWVLARRLLKGETIALKNRSITACLHPGAALPEDRFAIAVPSDFSIRVGDEIVPLGQQITHCAIAEVQPGSRQPHEDHTDVIIQAVDDTPMTMRLARPSNGE
jgi:hypothetical protein